MSIWKFLGKIITKIDINILLINNKKGYFYPQKQEKRCVRTDLVANKAITTKNTFCSIIL